jgi:hypothetical protein
VGTDQQQRIAWLMHGMQVQQPVRMLDKRKQFTGTLTLQTPGVGDPRGGPLAVQVFIDKAGGIEGVRIEPVEGRKIAKGQRETPLPRPNPGLEQSLDSPSAAKLISVDQRCHHHASAGDARLKMPDTLCPRIAGSPSADTRLGQLESQRCHSLILAKSTTF